MKLLLPDDYLLLLERGIEHDEDQESRFLFLRKLPFPAGLYNQQSVELLVKIPSSYPEHGIDMFWTFPRLTLASGVPINNTFDYGNQENTHWGGREFCRWSRHWHHGRQIWRPNIDDMRTILSRLKWCLANPNVSITD